MKMANVTISGHERLLSVVPNGSQFTTISLLGTDFCAAHYTYITYDYRNLQVKLSFNSEKDFPHQFPPKPE